MEQRRRNSSGAEGDAGGGALEPASRTALLRRSGYRRAPTQGLSGHSSHELKGVPDPVTLFRLVRASGGGRRSGQRPQDWLRVLWSPPWQSLRTPQTANGCQSLSNHR
jgi:hypothetical protein